MAFRGGMHDQIGALDDSHAGVQFGDICNDQPDAAGHQMRHQIAYIASVCHAIKYNDFACWITLLKLVDNV